MGTYLGWLPAGNEGVFISASPCFFFMTVHEYGIPRPAKRQVCTKTWTRQDDAQHGMSATSSLVCLLWIVPDGDVCMTGFKGQLFNCRRRGLAGASRKMEISPGSSPCTHHLTERYAAA